MTSFYQITSAAVYSFSTGIRLSYSTVDCPDGFETGHALQGACAHPKLRRAAGARTGTRAVLYIHTISRLYTELLTCARRGDAAHHSMHYTCSIYGRRLMLPTIDSDRRYLGSVNSYTYNLRRARPLRPQQDMQPPALPSSYSQLCPVPQHWATPCTPATPSSDTRAIPL